MTTKPRTTKSGEDYRAQGAGRVWLPVDSKFWRIQYYSSTGRQIRESSKSTSEREAEKLLKTKIAEVRLHLDAHAGGLRYDDIRASYLTACVQREDKSLPRKADGSLVLGADGLPKYSPIGLLDEFFGGLRVKKIQRLLVDEFVNREQARGLANGTINRSISKLKAMFNLAKEKGTLRDADIPPSWPVLPEASPRRGFFEPGEYRALLTALPGHLKPLLAIGYATGLRVGEIRGLRWEQVDFLGGLIRLRDRETKNNEARSAPLTSDLRAILLAHRAACPKDFPWVCFAFDTAGHAQKIKSFDRCWQNTCVKIGLGRWAQAVHSVTGEPLFDKPGGPRSEPKPKMTYDGKLFHDLRRSGIRNLVRAGVTQDVAQKISGHRTASVFSRYNVTDERDIIDAGKLLDKFNGEQIRGSSGAVLQIPEEANQLKN